MANMMKNPASIRLVLEAETAADLMTPNPLSVPQEATVKEAAAFLTDHGFSAAPVIDSAGRPVGVLSRTDIVIHDRETVAYLPERTAEEEWRGREESGAERLGTGFLVEDVDRTAVHELMTPTVFSVPLDMPAARVVEDMLALKVHQLYVLDRSGVLVGVISALDILRRLVEETVEE